MDKIFFPTEKEKALLKVWKQTRGKCLKEQITVYTMGNISRVLIMWHVLFYTFEIYERACKTLWKNCIKE